MSTGLLFMFTLWIWCWFVWLDDNSAGVYVIHSPLPPPPSNLTKFHPNLTHPIHTVHKVSDEYRITAAGTYQSESDGSKVKLLADENELEPQLLTFDMILSNNDLTMFIIHEACWNILKGYFHNATVPLNQLGALLQWWPEENTRKYYRYSSNKTPGISLSEKEDPSAPINIFTNNLGPLDDLPQPSGAVARQRREKLRTIGSGDCFARLPLEMREMIAAYMPILDFYRLRLVSRSMGELFFSKKGFWNARFEIDSERDFMAVPKTLLHTKKGSWRDWRLIYYLTNVHHIQLDWVQGGNSGDDVAGFAILS